MDKKIKVRLIRRLKIIEGQIRGLQRMVGEERYCPKIIYQSLAVKQALTKAEELLLENHLLTHVIEQIKTGEQGRAIKEILMVYKLSKEKSL